MGINQSSEKKKKRMLYCKWEDKRNMTGEKKRKNKHGKEKAGICIIKVFKFLEFLGEKISSTVFFFL